MEKFDLNKFKLDTKEEISKLNYKKYFYQYGNIEKNILAQEMKDIEVFLKDELELEVYPIYGTLLGMIRDNDFIAQDTDIDMAYLSKCHTEKTVLNEFNMICNFLKERDLLLYRIKTASHIHMYSPNKHLRIDLWISWIGEDGKYYLTWIFDGEYDKNLVLPFKTISFKNKEFKLVNNADEFLKFVYGDYNNPKEKDFLARKPVFRLEQWKGK